MNDPLGLLNDPQDQAQKDEPIQSEQYGFDSDEVDRFWNSPVTVKDPLGALTSPEDEEKYYRKYQEKVISEAPSLEPEREAWEAKQAAAQREEEGWQEPAEDIPGLMKNIAGDVLGVMSKVGAGMVKELTLGAVDPSKGTINVPFTAKKVADYAPPLDAALKDIGVSKEIAKNPYLDPIGQFVGIAGPWTALSKAYTWAANTLNAARAAREAARAGTAVGRSTAAVGAPKDATAVLWERAYAGTGQRIGTQAAVGGTVGAAHVKESPEDSVIVDALVGAASGAALQGFLEVAHRAASAAGATRFGAYLNFKAELSELLFNETGKMTKAEADVLADYLIRVAAKERDLNAWAYRGMRRRWEQARSYKRAADKMGRPPEETVEAEYEMDQGDVPDFGPGMPPEGARTTLEPTAPGRGMAPATRAELPPGQGFRLEGPPRDVPVTLDAAYGADMPPGPPPHPGRVYSEQGIPIEVMRLSPRQIPLPEDFQGQRALPPGERGFELKGKPYDFSADGFWTPLYDLRYEPGREGDWYDGFIMSGKAYSPGPPDVISTPPPRERGLLPAPGGVEPPPSPPAAGKEPEPPRVTLPEDLKPEAPAQAKKWTDAERLLVLKHPSTKVAYENEADAVRDLVLLRDEIERVQAHIESSRHMRTNARMRDAKIRSYESELRHLDYVKKKAEDAARQAGFEGAADKAKRPEPDYTGMSPAQIADLRGSSVVRYPDQAPSDQPVKKYYATNADMKPGMWKIVDRDTGQTVKSGISSKAAADSMADSMSESPPEGISGSIPAPAPAKAAQRLSIDDVKKLWDAKLKGGEGSSDLAAHNNYWRDLLSKSVKKLEKTPWLRWYQLHSKRNIATGLADHLKEIGAVDLAWDQNGETYYAIKGSDPNPGLMDEATADRFFAEKKENDPFQGKDDYQLSLEDHVDRNMFRKPYAKLTEAEISAAAVDVSPGDMRAKVEKYSFQEKKKYLDEIRNDTLEYQIEGKGSFVNKMTKRKNTFAHYRMVSKALDAGKTIPWVAVQYYPDLRKEAQRKALLDMTDAYRFRGTSEAMEYGIDNPDDLESMKKAYDAYLERGNAAKQQQDWKTAQDLLSGVTSKLKEAIEAAQGIFGDIPEPTLLKRPRLAAKIKKAKEIQASIDAEKPVDSIYRIWSRMLAIQDGQSNEPMQPLLVEYFRQLRSLTPEQKQRFGLMIQNGRLKIPADLARNAKAELESRFPEEKAPEKAKAPEAKAAKEPPPALEEEAEGDWIARPVPGTKNWEVVNKRTGQLYGRGPSRKRAEGNARDLNWGEREKAKRAKLRKVYEMDLSEWINSPEMRDMLDIPEGRPLEPAEIEEARLIHMRAVSERLKNGEAIHGRIIADYPDLGPHKDYIAGNKDTAKTAEGTEVSVTYAIMKLSDLTASHDTQMRENPAYPQRFQNRNRNKEASKQQLQDYSGPKFEPRYYGPNFSTVHGAPIVLPTGVVISGNMRTITLMNIDPERYVHYRDFIYDQLKSVGIKATLSELPENAVLVRIIDPAEIPDLRRFAEESNREMIAGLSAAELAKQDAGRMTQGMVSMWDPGTSGNIAAASNRPFITLFLQQCVSANERDSFMRPDGSPTKAGLDRMRNAMFEVAYRNASALETIAENPDDNIRNVTNALIAVSGRFARLRSLVDAGARVDRNIAEEVAQAAMKFAHLREQGMPVEFYFDQTDMFAGDVQSIEKELLRLYDTYKRSSIKLRNILLNYLDTVDALGDPRTVSMFADMKYPTKDEILAASIKYLEEGHEPKLFDDTPPGGSAISEPSQEYQNQTATPEFKAWFGKSQVVDERGNPLVVYTGHRNAAIIGDRFSLARATAGGFYFTQTPDVAGHYALGKWGQQEYWENGDQFIVYQAGKPVRIWNYILTDDQIAKIEQHTREDLEWDDFSLQEWIDDQAKYDAQWRRIKNIGGQRNLGAWWLFMESAGYNVAYARDAAYDGEPYVFRQDKGLFMRVMDAAGINWQSHTWDQPGVFPVYLRIENPFTIDVAAELWNDGDPQGVMKALWDAARREPHRDKPWDDKWTRDYSIKSWMDDLQEMIETEKDSYWATQIPTKARRILLEHGYDGIKDLGGKMGGPEHIVWIALKENQIKSAIGNKGTFSLKSNSIARDDSSSYQAVIDFTPSMTEKIAQGAEEVGLGPGEVRPVVQMVPIEKIGIKGMKAYNHLDVALVGRTIAGMDAQEQLLILVTGQSNEIISLFRFSRGGTNYSMIQPGVVAGAVLNTPGAANAWMIHNHPSGSPMTSNADMNSARMLGTLFSNTPVKFHDFIAVTDTAYSSVGMKEKGMGSEKFPDESGNAGDAVEIPILERRFAQRGKNQQKVENQTQAFQFGLNNMPSGGIVLLDSNLKVVGAVRVPDVRKLSGEAHQNLLKEIERRNASRMIAIYPTRSLHHMEVTYLQQFANATAVSLEDVQDINGSLHLPHQTGTWFHPYEFKEEVVQLKKGAEGGNPIDRYVKWLMDRKRIVKPHDGVSLEPPDIAFPMIPVNPPVGATRDISIWSVGQSPHHVLGRVWTAKDSPVIDALEASMTLQQNVSNDDKWAAAVLNHAGITNEIKAITQAVKPLFEKNRALIEEYAKIEGAISTINAQLRKIPIHQEYDTMEREVARLERLIKKIDKHIINLKTEKAVKRWEATRRRTMKMIERRMEKLSALEMKYMRIRQINDLRTRKAQLRNQQRELLPGFKMMEAEFDGMIVGLARKHADVRVFLAAEDMLPPGVKLTKNEVEAAIAIKKFMVQKRDALESMLIPVITDKAYMTHLWKELLEDDGVRMFAFEMKRTPAILAFMNRLPNSRPWIPSAAAVLRAYIPTVNFKLSYQPVLNRWRPVVDTTLEPNLRNYLQTWINENIYRRPATMMERGVNALVSFEYVRLIGLSLSVGFKHLLKLANTWAVYGPSVALPATARMAKVPGQAIWDRFTGKQGSELRAIRAFVTQKALIRALDEIPVLHRAMNRFKLVMGQPVVAVEYFDNGVSILAGILKGLRKDMPYDLIHRGIWETILDANFRAGWDQPLWQKRWGARALTMFQMTPFKLFEMKLKLIENAIKNKRDAFGTHYGSMLLRFLLIIGAAESVARANNTSILEMFLHFPFVRGVFHSTKTGYEFGHPKPAWPPTAQMLEEWKDKGFVEGLSGTHEDWGIITKEYKAQTGRYSKEKYAGPVQYRLGLPRIDYDQKKAKKEAERLEKEKQRKPSKGPFNLRKAYQTTH